MRSTELVPTWIMTFSEMELDKLLRSRILPKLQVVEEPITVEGESRVDLPLPSVPPGTEVGRTEDKQDFMLTLGLSLLPSKTVIRGKHRPNHPS